MRLTRIAVVTLALASLSAPARAGALEDGRAALKDRRWAQAADAFATALKASPGSREAVVGLATAATEGKVTAQYELATSSLSAWLREKADDREARLAYGYLFLARAAVDERYRADAQEQFQRLLKADADDADATVGLGRYYYFGGDYVRGLETLDGLLAKKPTFAPAHYWRGRLLYDEAEQAVRGGMTPEVQAKFVKAADAFEAAAKADPAMHDAWMRLAYASQYLSGADASRAATAEHAYLKALDIDPADDAPLRGLSSLFANASGRYVELLGKLAKDKPKSAAVLFHWGWTLKGQGKVDEALAAWKAHVAVARNPSRGWFEIAQALREQKNDLEGARKAYRAALEADPRFRGSELAVYWLLQPIEERSRDAVTSLAAAKALLAEFDEVARLAPGSISARNDAAFFLREAYGATKQKHRELLDGCIERYVAASALVGEFVPGYERSVPYPDRHGFAQVLNDTGLMFQYYPETRDLRKAESYYRKAMDWTEYGYWDAYGNLLKILEAENRLEDAAIWAENCAEGVKKADGSPEETFRKICAADAERLKKSLGR